MINLACIRNKSKLRTRKQRNRDCCWQHQIHLNIEIKPKQQGSYVFRTYFKYFKSKYFKQYKMKNIVNRNQQVGKEHVMLI